MTIERKSVVDQIEVNSSVGGVGVRIALQLVENGEVLSSKWHRTMIPAEISPAEQLGYVNAHLASMGEAPLTSSDIQRVGLFHKLSVDLPSEEAKAKTVDEMVADINLAKASRVVDAS